MKFLRRLFGWFTLISLMVWIGVAAWIVLVQYRDAVPVGYPSTYADCVAQWSNTVADGAKAAQIKTRCGDYYALLGDPGAPVVKRLQQQVQGRLTEKIVDAYLKSNPPQPGETVSGADVVAALGSARILELFYQAVVESPDPPSVKRRAQLRCALEETRRAQMVVDPNYITQNCMRL
jgi:hypothetical protein